MKHRRGIDFYIKFDMVGESVLMLDTCQGELGYIFNGIATGVMEPANGVPPSIPEPGIVYFRVMDDAQLVGLLLTPEADEPNLRPLSKKEASFLSMEMTEYDALRLG